MPTNFSITKDTKLCISLAGRPGNYGTRFHNYLYRALHLNYLYKAFTTTHLGNAIAGIRALGIRGCAISMPYKEAVIPFVDKLDISAQRLQSINTIVNDEGVLTAFNTDYIAIQSLLKTYLLSPDSPFILRGSGGMAKAVAGAFYDMGFKRGTILARNKEKGQFLAALYGYNYCATDAECRLDERTLLVNVTPLGMAGAPEKDCLAFPESWIKQVQTIFDVVALPVDTPLLQAAKRTGKSVISGADVAKLQAIEQFVLYTGIRPEDSLVDEAASFARNT